MVANLIIILDQVSATEDTPMLFLCEEDIMNKLNEVSAANKTVSEMNDDDLMHRVPTEPGILWKPGIRLEF